MDIDTATVEELWSGVLAEKLPGLKGKCSDPFLQHRSAIKEGWNPSCCGGTGTVPIAPDGMRLLEELRKKGATIVYFDYLGPTICCTLSFSSSGHKASDGKGITDLEALCRAAAKALEVKCGDVSS